MNKAQETLILTQDLQKLVWKLSLPSIAAMVFLGLNTVADAFFVGQLLGKTALAGVALANPYIAIVMGLGYGIGAGAGNVLSIALGANNTDRQQQLLGTVAALSLVCASVLAGGLYVFAKELLQMIGGRGPMLDYGVAYLRTALCTAPIWVYALSLNMLIRGEGKMLKSAQMIFYTLLANVILTPCFIKYFHMGVVGAAWATNIGMLLLAVQGFLYFFKGKASFQSDIKSMSCEVETGQLVLQAGFASFMFNLMSLVQALVVFYIVAGIGSAKQIAFYAATNVLYLFLMTPLHGLMRALQPVAGINFGASQYLRVKESFLLFSKKGILLILPLWALLILFPQPIMQLILPDASISATDLIHFRIYIFSIPFLPIVFMSLALLPAINQSLQATRIVLGRQLLLYIPVMIVLPRFLGLSGVYLGSSLVNITIFVWTLLVLDKTMKKL